MRKLLNFLSILLTLLILVSCNDSVPTIPVQDFFKNPKQTAFELSPDGQYLAFMMPWRNRMNIHVQKIGQDEIHQVTHAVERNIDGYIWGSNNQIVFVQDQGGDENFRAYVVGVDGRNPKDLTPFKNVQVRLLDKLEDNQKEILISMNKRNPKVFDVYRVNLNTGKLRMIARNPGNVDSWITDNNGKLRVATTFNGVNTSILYRKSERRPFRRIVTTNFKNTIKPLLFTFDNKYLYVSSNIHRDKSAIYKFDIENGHHLELIYEHPLVDVTNLLRSKKRKVITGVSFISDKRHYFFFDEQRKKLQEELEGKLPGYEVTISSMSKDETKILIRTYSDKSLGAYYYYDMANKDFKKLVEISPWPEKKHMCSMKPIKYISRDGMTIHGYLTLPRGKYVQKIRPLVVLPHGGPWHRDVWGFNPTVQFLANRGYAVLQINFRGSTGYGKQFWKAGFKKWGKEMQNDITDGVKWAVKQKTANRERVGIFGSSYGGYATLAGLAFTPDLYACGIDYVGMSNLFTFLSSFPPYWELYRQVTYEKVGHPIKDRELLEAASPLFHVDKIKAPLFVAQGANDPRVKKAESDQIVQALEKRGVDVVYMVKDDEGHGFANEENKIELYREIEKFLEKHLKAAKSSKF